MSAASRLRVCRIWMAERLPLRPERAGPLRNGPHGFSALYERLIFQNLTYNAETPCCNPRPIPVLLIMTSNAPDNGYPGLLQNYRQTLSRFVGPTEIFTAGDTLQLKDYSKTDWPWSFFDPEHKRRRHETVFPQKCAEVFGLGSRMAGQGEKQ